MKKIALVTVTYNAESNMSFFLPSIQKNQNMVGGIFLIDNNSSDSTVQAIKEWEGFKKDQVDLAIYSENMGYAYAINVGIRKALSHGFDYILVTNNDIVFDEGALEQMYADMTLRNADVIGVPASVSESELGIGYNLNPKTRLLKDAPSIVHKDIEAAIELDPAPLIGFVHGGTLLFKKRFFSEIGLYDPELFFGGDELDFTYRVDEYNRAHEEKIICAVSLRSFLKMDNLTKHNNRHKFIKAKRILQGTVRVYLKHRFTPKDIGLYKQIFIIIQALGRGRFSRYFILWALSMRALALETYKYYTARLT
jgi:GT2 family glycosyltransferase